MKKLLSLLVGLLWTILPSYAQTVVDAGNVTLVNGKYYTIKSDNQTGNKFYLTDDGGTLKGYATEEMEKNSIGNALNRKQEEHTPFKMPKLVNTLLIRYYLTVLLQFG